MVRASIKYYDCHAGRGVSEGGYIPIIPCPGGVLLEPGMGTGDFIQITRLISMNYAE